MDANFQDVIEQERRFHEEVNASLRTVWGESSNEEARGEDDPEWQITQDMQFLLRVACTTALYPLEYAKTLIQIGYEPIAPRPGRTLFGERRLMLPNVFQYAAHIKSVDGFFGCFRGLSARLVGNFLSSYYGGVVADRLGYREPPKSKGTDAGRSRYTDDRHKLKVEFVMNLKRNLVVHSTGIVISQPFYVISIRMMAQFVGRERIYTGLVASIKEIWKTEGVAGFFSGLIPRLVCDLGCVLIGSTLTYLLSATIVEGESSRNNLNTLSHFTASSVLYPYHVVSTCMIVNGSRLKAGNLPLMENYVNWTDCYSKLRATNEHKRGSSLFFRAVPKAITKASNIFAPYPEMK
ncbi:mitochondrial carrier homolog 2-like [Anopheles albimanus]|uniref:Mitochondrial carrier n=1 Tax=Anopheles albimanus TaxID=7167 RepID=A0A182FDV6_ANOAL|nr:mitochondrial carrier homolog 2-like [Anopheles albimanus]XP_035788414.1 mitochondrial carrier homolog 2-like [Anopheles albimanus]XP_035788415.1 mitochondrial carrier homolog 2-like [Anopheles albimanus]XP_035788416.1 mitochondrial carrier homolog 2-like [Anopheles albimanus]XP_035788417.1 mitochondrial carrier homolog 2-like [Anopheles albimanus]XP_035788418.1 mitochondrial carrier homolog 2-like [Anopheles albimanus]XP_035788419.1 mitochondrial carrier homolog 2-like [Anopheles albimanu